MSEDKAFYFKFRNDRSYQSTREEWEQDWLDWWYKVNDVKDID